MGSFLIGYMEVTYSLLYYVLLLLHINIEITGEYNSSGFINTGLHEIIASPTLKCITT